MAVQIIKSLEENIHWLGPLGMPVVFVGFSFFFQSRFGQSDFRFFGGEVSLAATSSLLGAVMHGLLLPAGPGPQRAAALGLVVLAISFVLTVFLYSTGAPGKTSTKKTVVSACLASAWFYLSAALSWHIIGGSLV